MIIMSCGCAYSLIDATHVSPASRVVSNSEGSSNNLTSSEFKCSVNFNTWTGPLVVVNPAALAVSTTCSLVREL